MARHRCSTLYQANLGGSDAVSEARKYSWGAKLYAISYVIKKRSVTADAVSDGAVSDGAVSEARKYSWGTRKYSWGTRKYSWGTLARHRYLIENEAHQGGSDGAFMQFPSK